MSVIIDIQNNAPNNVIFDNTGGTVIVNTQTIGSNQLVIEQQDEINIVIANSTVGLSGANGLSAYQIAVNNGFIGTEAQWLLSLNGGNINYAYEESLIGVINGINRIFTTNNIPLVNSIKIYIGGQRLKNGYDYTIIGNIVTFLFDIFPSDSNTLFADYRY